MPPRSCRDYLPSDNRTEARPPPQPRDRSHEEWHSPAGKRPERMTRAPSLTVPYAFMMRTPRTGPTASHPFPLKHLRHNNSGLVSLIVTSPLLFFSFRWPLLFRRVFFRSLVFGSGCCRRFARQGDSLVAGRVRNDPKNCDITLIRTISPEQSPCARGTVFQIRLVNRESLTLRQVIDTMGVKARMRRIFSQKAYRLPHLIKQLSLVLAERPICLLSRHRVPILGHLREAHANFHMPSYVLNPGLWGQNTARLEVGGSLVYHVENVLREVRQRERLLWL